MKMWSENANVVNTNRRSAVTGLSAWRLLWFWCVHLFFGKKKKKSSSLLSHCSLLPAQLKKVSNLSPSLRIHVNYWHLLGGSVKTLHQHFLQKFSFIFWQFWFDISSWWSFHCIFWFLTECRLTLRVKERIRT